jgi:AbiU2
VAGEAVTEASISPEKILEEFYNLCVEARDDFDLYRSLLEEADPSTMRLCFEHAPYFFSGIRRIIMRDLVLDVCKLTDPAAATGPI